MRAQQVRYVVRGLRGTFAKGGVDVQEDQLRVLPDVAQITEWDAYGKEPEALWGTVENVGEGGKIVTTT